jgi:PAS domain S-box-containing protein
MKNTDKSQPKQTRRQGRPKVQPGKENKPLEKRQPPATTVQDSDEKFRRLFETEQDGIFLLDAETGVIIEINPSAEDILGYSRTELIGKKLWETGPFKDVSASQNTFLKFQKKSHFRYEDLPLETKDGGHRTVEFVSNIYRVGSQKIIQCNLRDITERRQVENARVESNRRYQELFDNASLGIFQSAADGKIVAVNREFAHMFGYQSPEEFISLVRSAADIFADPQRRAEIIRLMAGNPDVTKFENHYRRKDGSIFHGNLTVRQVTGPDGHEIFFEGFIEDITERRQAEDALRESEERYRTLAETAPDMIFIIDRKGRVEYINEFAARVIGYPSKEVVGKRAVELFSAEVSRRQKGNIQKVFKSGEPLYYEGQTGFPGRDLWLGSWLVPMKNETGEVVSVFGISRDITERKHAEEALAESENKFRWLYEYAPIAYHILTPDGIITDVNRRWCELLGYPREAVIGKPIFDFAVKDERETAKASFEKKKQSRQSFVEGSERNFLTKDGAIRTF